MKITLLHNAVVETDTAADRDVLVQAAAVEEALHKLGHATRRLACSLNFELVEGDLVHDRPDVVFNLVESLGGTDRLAHLAAVLLENLDLPYTGTRAEALHLTNNKPRAKERLRAAKLPTPDWVVTAGSDRRLLAPPYIIKAIWEHASVGLDDHAIVRRGDGTTVCQQIESRTRQLGYPCFAEQYVEGREFNISLLAGKDGPQVLPPAEIDFPALPDGKARIVGYAAKWDPAAPEFHGTPRTFDFPKSDAPLLETLRSLALAAWRLFDLRGYARVDFRVDAQGQPWILEINANPCLSPDAGFAAALARGQIPLEQAVAAIMEDALRPMEVPAAASDAVATAGATATAAEPKSVALTPALSEGDGQKAATRSKRVPAIKFRDEVRPDDAEAVRKLVASSGLFREGEIDVAVELVQARLEKGAASGYEFLFAEQRGKPVGYACYGRNPVTVSSFDLYWIAVDRTRQGQGIGRLLLEEVERRVAAASGTRVYIETSHRADYQATRGFYERCGYQLEAVLADFYAPGDDRAIYVKALDR